MDRVWRWRQTAAVVNEPLLTAVRQGLAALADPAKAPGMQAYMKSVMLYRGVHAPAQERLFRRVFAEHPLAGVADWRDTVLALWRRAAFREERYAAIALSGHRLYRAHQTPATVPMYEEMIVTGAWWDYVDAVATNRIGPLVRAHPGALKPVMRGWSTDVDLWRRRTSILCQIGAKADTDLDLLYACIEPNLADRDFFIRKAIGWALRQYAWIDPAEVTRYVEQAGDRLSGLSRREALKNVARIRDGSGR